jgi:hypothetical protein
VNLRSRGTALVALLVVAVAGAALVATAGAQKIVSGNLVFTIEGSITPLKLPRKKPAPVKLSIEGSIATNDGTHPPPVKELFLEFDRNGHLNTEGLASCTVGKLQSTLTNQAKAKCSKALIGTGRAMAEIAFPEQAPFSAGGPLLIFNGSRGNKQMLIFHVYAKVPAPTTFVTTAVIGKGKGPYGTSARVRVPAITSGQGSLIGFKASIKKTFRVKGHKQSVLTATCKTGSLRARGQITFVGAKLAGLAKKPCTPMG